MANYKRVILDASALIAFLFNEKGSDIVADVIFNSIMSSVNIAETAKIMMSKRNMKLEDVKYIIKKVISDTLPFDEEQAFASAALDLVSKDYGLSLGDRACLALSLKTGAPIYTADKIWKNLDLLTLEIHVIR